MQGLGQHGASGDIDHQPIRHDSAVQRHHGIGVFGREQLRMERAIAPFQRFAQRADTEAFFKIGGVGQFWRERSVDQHQPAHALDGMQLQGGARAL